MVLETFLQRNIKVYTTNYITSKQNIYFTLRCFSVAIAVFSNPRLFCFKVIVLCHSVLNETALFISENCTLYNKPR